ncbi:uroporphyrinogen-III decarboxylase [Candidatus Vecturithrix granuli]|uniref:Uroporphyrinogen-III decarboxylase n=1 Tax=Vecturithrix granuli TaxID=1499967 RepID=A0A081C0W0_VECG1|nr:uroporphyrinogen-III decarboxylase [Candidatus Vecturithrix granuli]
MTGKETMTSRERVVKALSFEEPDRVPIDLGGFQTGIHKRAYEDLLAYFGWQEELEILDPVQQLVKPSEAVLTRFHVDTRYIVAHAPQGFQGRIEQHERDGKLWRDLKDEFGVVWSMPEDQQLYMDISRHPLADATLDDIRDYPFPNGSDPTRFTGVREQAIEMRNNTPYALSTGIFGVVYEVCWYMRGLERWFIDMMENPTFCEALLDQTLKYWLDYTAGFMQAVGDLVDVVMIGDDLTGQKGPLFSPKFYRQVVKPRQKKLVQHLKSLTNAKVWYHTCGACTAYIPDLLDNGIDILNPIQISAKDMEPERLKREFGKQLVFWGGGIDTQHVLPFARPEEIRQHVKRNLEIFKPGGGYVFNNVHNIQYGVPAQNTVALFDAAYEYGFYKE